MRPLKLYMGRVQKIFYFHLSAAWVGMLGFGVAVVAGVAYLVTRQRKWDIAGYAAVEVSLVFFLIAIVAGSIWARRTWGTWWTWDPRLTSAAIVELVYAAYLMLRQGIEDPDRRARFGAVYAIVAFISVPITFLSIRILRTIHPDLTQGEIPAGWDSRPKWFKPCCSACSSSHSSSSTCSGIACAWASWWIRSSSCA